MSENICQTRGARARTLNIQLEANDCGGNAEAAAMAFFIDFSFPFDSTIMLALNRRIRLGIAYGQGLILPQTCTLLLSSEN